MGKSVIIFIKFIIAMLFGALIFILAPLYHIAVYALLGQAVPAGMTSVILSVALKHCMTTLAFSALSGIVAYGSQRATFAIVLYLLLSFGVVGSLVTVVLNTFAPKLTGVLVSRITDKIIFGLMNGERLALHFVGYTAYLLTALMLSVVAFNKKEMEF